MKVVVTMTLKREEDTGPAVEDLDVVTETIINELNDLQFWFDNSDNDATNYEVDVEDVVVELPKSDEPAEEGAVEESAEVEPANA